MPDATLAALGYAGLGDDTLDASTATKRKIPTTADGQAALTADVVALAIRYACTGRTGWRANLQRVDPSTSWKPRTRGSGKRLLASRLSS